MVFPERTPPHEIAAGLVIDVRKHAEPLLADRRPVFFNRYCIWDCLGPPAFIVQVDKRPDLPIFQEAVSWIVVHGGIEAYVLDRKGGHMFFQFMEGNEEADKSCRLALVNQSRSGMSVFRSLSHPRRHRDQGNGAHFKVYVNIF